MRLGATARRLLPVPLSLTLGLLLAPARSAAQGIAPPGAGAAQPGDGRCHGEIVDEIVIRAEEPPESAASSAWLTAQRIAHWRHPTTQPAVVSSFLLLHVGQRCTEVRRSESERVLRLQPFLASARVIAVPDDRGGVRLFVLTYDEIPLSGTVHFRSTSLEGVRLGDHNIRGSGLGVVAGMWKGHAYRTGYSLGVSGFGMFRQPVVLSVDAEREPIGSLLAADIGKPYFSNLQLVTWHASLRDENAFLPIVRPAGDPLALQVRTVRWDVGGLVRVPFFGQVAGVGLIMSGIRSTPASAGVVVSDTGLVPDTGTALIERYAMQKAMRPGLIAGVRAVHFVTVRGFNSLNALEDLTSGVQFGLLAERGIQGYGSHDVFLSGSFYAGHATPWWYLALEAEMERRKNFTLGRWDDFIMSGRAAWYVKPTQRSTFVLADEVSGGSDPALPFQLALGDREGGVRGYSGARIAGSWRNVVRAEQRWMLGSVFQRADVGVAAFADAGTLWAGSVPYGTNVALRTSFGASLLAAFPRQSRRLVRIDIVVPTTTRDGNAAWEVRFNIVDLTRRFWSEPGDVTRSRLGPVPSSIVIWPTH